MRTALRPLALALGLAGAPALSAQETVCDIRMADPATGRLEQVMEGGATLIVAHDPFIVTCTDGAELRASTGRMNRTTRELHLVGNVFFQDPERTLNSAEAIYNAATARLWAQGDVVFVDRAEGTTLRGPELEYFRATDERPVSRMTAPQRPTLTMPPRDGPDDAEPMVLVADRIEIEGEDDLSAFGSVVVTRSDMRATSGEARFRSADESFELRRQARITTEEYELAAEVVQARLVNDALEHVHARTDASMRGEDLTVEAPEIELFFADEVIRRAVAVAPAGGAGEGGRASAVSRAFRIDADSLDATFVEQRLDEVHAVGSARAESVDTAAVAGAPPVVAANEDEAAEDTAVSRTRPEILASDWIRGDTIIGYFVPVAAPRDTAATQAPDFAEDAPPVVAGLAEPADEEERPAVELNRIVARGSALSFYRLAGERDGPGERNDVNFLVGDIIELDLADGEMQVAQVTGLHRGIYLEALPSGPGGEGPAPDVVPATVPDTVPAPPADDGDGPVLGTER